MHFRVGFVVVMVATAGCNGRKTQIEAYEREICACKDVQCVLDADHKYQSTLRPPQTWFEKHFVSASADRAMSESVRRAEACAGAFRSTDYRCGGESGEGCPPGYRCAGIDRSVTDGQGACLRIPGYVAKAGDRCGGPEKIGCEPGSTCGKAYRGEKSIELCLSDVKGDASVSASSSAKK